MIATLFCNLIFPPSPAPDAWRISLRKVRCFAFEQAAQVASREAKPDEKSPEKTVNCARFVEAHLVDQLLEDQRVIGEKIHAPLPIVEADGTRNYLNDPPGIVTPDHAMLAHHPLAFGDRLTVPVLTFAAKLVHRVKGHIAPLRNLRPKTRRRGLPLLGQFHFYLSVPFGASRLQSLRYQIRVEFHRSFVEPQFNHGDVGTRWFEEFM